MPVDGPEKGTWYPVPKTNWELLMQALQDADKFAEASFGVDDQELLDVLDLTHREINHAIETYLTSEAEENGVEIDPEAMKGGRALVTIGFMAGVFYERVNDHVREDKEEQV